VLYRVGETRGGAATYTPRMVFFERRGAMGGASSAGYLYGDESGTDGGPLPPILTWDGSAKVIEQPKEGKSRFVRQLEAYEEEEEEEEEDDDDDERRDDPRSADDFSPSDDSDAPDDFVSDARSVRDPMEALRKRMESHVLRADADERSQRSRELQKPRRVQKTAEERRAARDARKKREEEANALLTETSSMLEHESRSWTDFIKAPFHSRSAFLLDGVWSQVDAFGGFGEGVAWAETNDRREDLRDVARRWAEECDRLQGFQVFAEDLGGFGGLAYATLEELKDEYPRQPAWLFSLRPAKVSNEEGRRASSSAAADAEAARYSLLNDALATATLAPLCDAYVPLSADQAAGSRAADALPPGFSAAEGRNRFRASALAAAFADVAGTSWRAHGPTCLSGGARDMRDVARHLSARAGGPFVSASFVIDPEPGGDSKERRGEAGNERDKNAAADAEAAARRAAAGAPLRRFAGLTPGVRSDRTSLLSRRVHDDDSDAEEEDEPLAEAYATRGARRSPEASLVAESRNDFKNFASAASSLASLDAALSFERYRAPRLRFVSEAPLPVPLTFPRAFSLEKKNGETNRGHGSPSFIGATARVASSPAFGRVLTATKDGWHRAARGAAGRAALRAWGVDDDEVEEVAERVLELRRGYADDDADDTDDDDEELEQI
jgi:hypothetical protein